MCKFKFSTTHLPASVGITALCGLLAVCMPQAAQAQSCNPGGGGSLQVIGPYPFPFDAFVHVGQLGTITSAVFNNDGSCTLTNFRAWVVYPTNNVSMYIDLNPLHQTVPPTPTPGFQISCPSADTRCIPFQQSFLIRLQDIGNKIDFITNWPPGSSSGVTFAGAANTVQVGLLAAGDAIRTGGGHGGEQKAAGLIVLQPHISVTKTCPACTPFGQPINFTGTVCNTTDTNTPPTPLIVHVTNTVNGVSTEIPFPSGFDATTSSGRNYDGTLNNGECVNFHGSETPPGNGCGPLTNTVVAVGADQTGFIVNNTFTTVCQVCPANPAITVTKLCSGTNALPGGLLGFSGSVSNAGDITLTNVTIVDNVTLSGGGTLVASFPSLAPGQATNFSGSIRVPTNVCSITDTLTARGTNICSGAGVVGTDTKTCPVQTTPRLALTKTCPASPPNPGGTLTYSGTITNVGNVAITNITLTDSIFGTNTAAPTPSVIARLEPGAGATFSGSYTVPVDVCTVTDTLSASGTDVCGNAVSTNTTATCNFDCRPLIKVYKQVVCYPCEPFSSNLDSQKTATGVRVDPNNCPAFCYRVIVTNIGLVTLSGVTVSDNTGLNLAACGFPSTLAPHTSATCVVSNVTHCSSIQNIVTATGTGPIAGGGTTNVTATDTNNVTVVPISVACRLLVITGGATNEFHAPNCPQVPIGSSYSIRIVVTNTGSAALQNVVLTTTGTTPLTCLASPLNIGGLALNGTTNIDCVVNQQCTVPITNNYAVAVAAEASQSNGHLCVFNSNGVPITASSSCDTCVTCFGTPKIKVYKQVVCYPCEAFTNDLTLQKTATGVRVDPNNCPAFCYRVTVVNSGNVTLTGVTVSDDTGLNLSGCAASTLAPGASTSCTVSNVTHCSSIQNIVTAMGTGPTVGGGTTNVTATDTNNVIVNPISVACSLLVSTNGTTFTAFHAPNCPQVLVGSSYSIRIVVSNTSISNALQNVVLTTTGTTPLTCLASPLNIGSLALNGTTNIDCVVNQQCTVPITNNYAVAVSAEASQSNGHLCVFNSNGVPITASSACDTCVTCFGIPRIKVTKLVTCAPAAGIAGCDGTLSYSPFAEGVASATANAAFCYSITVSNSGDLVLNNVQVSDNLLPSVVGTFPTTLQVSQSVTHYYGMSFGVGSHTNTVTAIGTGTGTGQSVTNTSSAGVTVVQPGIACTKLVSSPDDTDGNPNDSNVTLPNDGNSHLVTYSVIVTNTGTVALTNVTILDPGLPTNCTPPAPFSLPVHGSTTLTLCTVPLNCNSTTTTTSGGSCGSTNLGRASAFGALQLGGGTVSISQGAFNGDVGVGPGGSFSISGPSTVTGTLYLAPGDSLSQSGGSTIGAIVQNANLSGPINDAKAFAATAALLPCTLSYKSWTGSLTVNGGPGTNVICVGSVNMSGTSTIVLNGPPGAKFIVNITGGFSLSGSSTIRVGGGVTPQDVVYNFIGSGSTIQTSGGGNTSGVDGSILAVNRSVGIHPGFVNGTVIAGGDIGLSSGAQITCPPPTIVTNTLALTNTVTVIGSVDTSGFTTSLCNFDANGNPIPTNATSTCSATVGCKPPQTNACPPVTSSINSGFNGTTISTVNFIWFNANFSATGIPSTGATIFFKNSSVAVNSAYGLYTYPVPDGKITFDPRATCATTTFDGTQWVTTVPLAGSDEILLSALGIHVPVDFKASSVTWKGDFSATAKNITVSWKWGAAVYTTDVTQPNYNLLGVKPTHTGSCAYSNSDHAGTPENAKKSVIGGARGGGGSNFTGSWSATGSANLCVQ